MTTRNRILVIDDKPSSADSTVEVLTDLRELLRSPREMPSWNDYEVTVAYDGETALRLLAERGPFHLVLTDIELGHELGGVEVLKMIRAGHTEDGEHGTASEVPVVALTGYTSGEFMHAGFNNILHRPLEPEDLLRAVAGILGG